MVGSLVVKRRAVNFEGLKEDGDDELNADVDDAAGW